MFDLLFTLLELLLLPSNCQLEQLVLSFRFKHLALKEVLILFEGLSTGRPGLDLFV